MTDLQSLITSTTNGILDQWTAEATATGADVDGYISAALDTLEVTEPEVSLAVGKAYLARMFGLPQESPAGVNRLIRKALAAR